MLDPEIRPDRDFAAPVAFGWRERGRLLVADLVVFDVRRCNWRYAAATVVGLFLPLGLARLLAMPDLSWIGIGAFLLAIGSSADEVERWRPLRMGIASLLGGLALATGVLAGANLVTAVAGMLVWGLLTALIGVCASPLAAMGLPIAWAYVELGLPSNNHTFVHAGVLGVLFALGGLLTFLITSTIGLEQCDRALRLRTSACFRALAIYLDGLGSRSCAAHDEPVSPEMRVRLAIAEARSVAARLRLEQSETSQERQTYLVLTELADRIFSLAAMLHEIPAQFDSSAGKPPLALFRKAINALASALFGKANIADMRRLLTALELERDHSVIDRTGIAYDVDKRIADELIRALRITFNEVPPSVVPVAPSTSFHVLDPLVGCLRRDSIVGRHALRFAVASSVAVVLFWVFPPPFGYWVPLTVTAVLKPYAGVTLARTVQRVVGTMTGILVGMGVVALMSAAWAHTLLVAVAFFCMMAVLPFNYSLAIFFLSVGLIPYEHLLTPGLDDNVGALRLAATAIGATVALIGGHILWPTFERETLPALMQTTLCSMARFAEIVLRPRGETNTAKVSDLRRQAGLHMTELQAALQHALSELGGDFEEMQAFMRAVTALQRLFLTLNAIMNATDDLTSRFVGARTAWDDLVASIYLAARTSSTSRADYAAPSLRPAAVLGCQKSAFPTFLDWELDQIASEVAMLQCALIALSARSH